MSKENMKYQVSVANVAMFPSEKKVLKEEKKVI
jgi:hypothetical protein